MALRIKISHEDGCLRMQNVPDASGIIASRHQFIYA